jgi:RimJ/RimL family protein N-acetyltransferase
MARGRVIGGRAGAGLARMARSADLLYPPRSAEGYRAWAKDQAGAPATGDGERRYHKCEAMIYAYNDASLGLHRRLGFVEEGRLRDHEFFAGHYHDVVGMGMTAEEFAERHPFGRL